MYKIMFNMLQYVSRKKVYLNWLIYKGGATMFHCMYKAKLYILEKTPPLEIHVLPL